METYIPMETFETERLIAKKLEISDFQLLHLMNQNLEVMATLGGICDEEETRKRLSWNLNQWSENGFGLLLFFQKGTNEFVGRGGIRKLLVDDAEEIEIAYALMPQAWGKGLATEIAKKLVEVGFKHYKVQSLIAGTQNTNKASRRVIEKAGFFFEKEITQFGRLQVVYRLKPYSLAEMESLLDRAFPGDDFITGPILGIEDDIIISPNVATLLAKPSTVIGTAAKDGKLVALSVAIPKSDYDPKNPDLKTAYVYYTVVEPSLQGRGLVVLAARSLEEQLKARGYVYLEQD